MSTFNEARIKAIVNKKLGFEPSEEQVQILMGFVKNENIAVSADAGTGKTTVINMAVYVLIEYFKEEYGRMPKLAYMAFNNHSVKEAREKLPNIVHVFSSHQLGNSLVRNLFPYFNLDKNDNTFKFRLKDMDMGKEYVEFCNLYMAYMPKSRNEFAEILKSVKGLEENTALYYAGIAETVVDDVSQHAIKSKKAPWLTFTQTIYLSALHKLKMKHGKNIGAKSYGIVYNGEYDYLFIDESQDTANMTRNMVKSGIDFSKIACFGQPLQAIFGFAGSNYQSMQLIADEYNCNWYDLNQSRRCPEPVTRHINNRLVIGSDGELKPLNDKIWSAKPGKEVEEISSGHMYNIIMDKSDELNDITIISRKTADAVHIFMQLLSQSIPSYIKGVDLVELAKMVISWLEKVDKDWNTLLNNIPIYRDRMFDRDDEDIPYIDLEFFNDSVEAFNRLLQLASDVNTNNNKVQFLMWLEQFASTENGVCASVAHRTKGDEYKYVFLYANREWPYIFKNQSAESYEQEINLLYVSLSRTLEELYLVD